ncbi:AbrB/MazE/SpoVT family DNA-binding domain-containing protein [Burkholderia cenocepacia]|uniref:AbrB family transcriptional regulator n=1 Tax=Burkholderia cenocepacia TaxID=95486 RepID=A0A3S9NL50_9BURK|nr:AbrB family transcriptional regulator [Burkholderia cenocepacia]AZQ56373.1 AbrB family transcriptional regulator [Burkholderia cenocepacia]
MRVAKWGNDLAVRLAAGPADALGLREGDEVEIVVHRAGALAANRHASPEALLLPLRRFGLAPTAGRGVKQHVVR